VVVNENAFFDILQEMQIHIPEELKQARRVQQQQERILAQAKEEATRIKGQARQEAEESLAQHEQIIVAQARAEQIIEEARREAQGLRMEANQYAAQVLHELEMTLDGSLKMARNGIKRLSDLSPAVDEDDASPRKA